MRGRAAHLASLLAALAFALAPLAPRAHVPAAAALGPDICTTAGGEAPASYDAHGDHCDCCTGTPPALNARPPAPLLAASEVAVGVVAREAPRAFPVRAASPRGPPSVSRQQP
jgi:hypothetical protein